MTSERNSNPELIEAMAREIKRQLQLYADMAGMDFRANDLEMAARAALAVARPAIERALLDEMFSNPQGDPIKWIDGITNFRKERGL